MDNCQICNSECERTFCDDCAKMVQSGIKDLQSELARLTAEYAELKRKLGVAVEVLTKVRYCTDSMCDRCGDEAREALAEIENEPLTGK